MSILSIILRTTTNEYVWKFTLKSGMNKYRMTPSVMKWVHYGTPLNDILNMDTKLMFKFSKNLLTFEFEAELRRRHITRIKHIALLHT